MPQPFCSLPKRARNQLNWKSKDWRFEENRAIAFPCRLSNHEPSVVDPYRSHFINWAISAPTKSRHVEDRQEHELSHTGTYCKCALLIYITLYSTKEMIWIHFLILIAHTEWVS